VHNGRSRSSKVIDIYTNRKLYISFLLVISSNFGRIVVEILTPEARNLLVLPNPPSFEASAQGNPLEFWDETYPEKLEGWGYCMILHDPSFNRF